MDIADPQAGSKPAAHEIPEIHSDRYRVHGTLGAGGMGVVFLAQDLRLHRQVAIKKLREEAASDNARQRIRQEARLLAQLNHPNIVALYDVLETAQESENGNIALVMEYIDGTTLRAWMREHTPSLQQKLSLLMQICQGLQQAHELGIIHRDLKPDNILIATSASGKVTAKITDFGIAKSQQLDEKTLTAENQLAGTVTAMSPEQIQGKTLDARSDLFSLGTIAYELLCGSRPFEKHEGGALAMASRITSEPHIPPQQAWPGIPEPLAVLLDKLLAKDPVQRPQSALIVYQGFELLYKQGLEADTEDFTATLTDLFTHHKVKSRRHWQRALGGVAAALVLSAGGYWGWKEITRLEPQYIAVMPVEINGEIRGEENAKALTRTMVRQALMNSVSQLKASALVSFEPKEGQDFEAQLQKLKDKGVTDALFAQLDCAQTRCETTLQRIGPTDSQIKQQSSFAFLADKRQEAEYRLANSSVHLFSNSYSKETTTLASMSEQDYSSFLNILGRLESKKNPAADLEVLARLIDNYPENQNLYRTHTQIATDLFVLTDDKKYLKLGLDILEQAKSRNISAILILELDLWLQTYNEAPKSIEYLIKKINSLEFPSAEILNKHARFLYTQGKYQASIKIAQKASALNPSAENLYLVALNQYASGNYEEAIESLANNISKHPNHWASHETLAAIYGEMGEYDTAESLISKIPPSLLTWQTYSNLGSAYFLQRKYKEALMNYQKALELAPNNIPTLGNIAEIYLIREEERGYKKYYRKILTATSGSSKILERTYHLLALAYLGQVNEAIPLAHKLNQDAPDDTYVKHAAAQIYALAGEYQSANYFIEQLLDQGMSAEWFALPIFHQLCTQPKISKRVSKILCK
ncbi:serine/threonine-protein kinase [uncultured Microbulbifer sp.]|uniref:serine/threonine-protein kinase n=1 Tax=uncultured Microbulbifer sp. TaxID=348147 RepID=UPI0025EFB92F|nr:serine/threonine-protein kinase [uncultured Microbulbifer sp.]